MSDYEDDFEVSPEKKQNVDSKQDGPLDPSTPNKSPTVADVPLQQKSVSSQNVEGGVVEKRSSYAESDRQRRSSIGMNNSSAEKNSVTENPSWLAPTEKRRTLSTSASPEPPQALENKPHAPPKDSKASSRSSSRSSYTSRSSSRKSSSRASSAPQSSPARSPRKDEPEPVKSLPNSPPKSPEKMKSPTKQSPIESPRINDQPSERRSPSPASQDSAKSSRESSRTSSRKSSRASSNKPSSKASSHKSSRKSSRASSRPRSPSRASKDEKPAPVSPPFIANEPPSSAQEVTNKPPRSRTPSVSNTAKVAHGSALLVPPPRPQQHQKQAPRVVSISPSRVPPKAAAPIITRRDLGILKLKNGELKKAVEDITQQLSLMAPGIIKLRKANSAGDSDRLTKLRNDILALEQENESLQKRLRNVDNAGSIERHIAAREAEIKELQQRNRWLEGEIRRNGKRLKEGDKLTFQQQKAILAEELRKDKAVAQVTLDKTTRDAEQAVSGREQAEAVVASLLEKDTCPELRITDIRTVIDLRIKIAEKLESIKGLKIRQNHAAGVAAQSAMADDAAKTTSSNLDAELEDMRKQVAALREVINEGMIKRGGASPVKHGRRSDGQRDSTTALEESNNVRKGPPMGVARRRLAGDIAANRSPSKASRPSVAASTPTAATPITSTPKNEAKQVREEPKNNEVPWLGDDSALSNKPKSKQSTPRIDKDEKKVQKAATPSTSAISNVPINKDPAWLALEETTEEKKAANTNSKKTSRSPTPPPVAPTENPPRRASWLDEETNQTVKANKTPSQTTPRVDSGESERQRLVKEKEREEKEEAERKIVEAKKQQEEEEEERTRQEAELAQRRKKEEEDAKRQKEEERQRLEEEEREREEEERKRKAAAPPPAWETPDWMKETVETPKPVQVAPVSAAQPPPPPPAKKDEDEEPDWLKD